MKFPTRFRQTKTADAVRLTVPFVAQDELAEDLPGRKNYEKPTKWGELGTVTLTIDLDSATIRDWPIGHTASLHLKPVDSGRYELLDGDAIIATREDYVPDCVPGSYGDYVIMTIDENGRIFDELRQRWTPDPSTIAADFGLDED